MPQKECLNEDVAGCEHCGRLRSRKWLVAYQNDGEHLWFCAGEKAKHGCRAKAKASGAVVWIAETAENGSLADTSTSSPEERELGCAFNTSAGATGSSTALVALPLLIKSAWQNNDALLMSQALARAHRSGLSLAAALSMTLNIAPMPSSTAVRPAYEAFIPLQMLDTFRCESNFCFVCVIRDGAHTWACNPPFQKHFGLREGSSNTASSLCNLFLQFMHPSDAVQGMLVYDELSLRLLSEGSRVMISGHVPPGRLVECGSSSYSGFNAQIQMQLVGVHDEHVFLVTWTPMTAAATAATWPAHELVRASSLPRLIVDEPETTKINLHPVRPRLVEDGPLVMEGHTPSSPTASVTTASFAASDYLEAVDVASLYSFSTDEVESRASPRDEAWPREAAQAQGACLCPSEQDEGATMTWSVDELCDIVAAT